MEDTVSASFASSFLSCAEEAGMLELHSPRLSGTRRSYISTCDLDFTKNTCCLGLGSRDGKCEQSVHRKRSDLPSAVTEAPGFPGSALRETLDSVPGVQGMAVGSGREISLESCKGVVGPFSWLL